MAEGGGNEKFVNLGEIDVLEITGVDDTVKNLIRRGKLWTFNLLFGDQWWADLFGVIQSADHTKAVPVSPSGVVNIVRDYLYRTVDIASVVGEEIGSESIMEMLSEGLSTALETNFNGALQYVLNVWKGSLPPDLSYALSLGQRLDRVSRLYALSQLAPIGHSPQAILEALISGADTRLREKLSTAKQTYLEHVTAKSSALTEQLTQAVNFLANVINELVFGAIQLLDRIDGLINAIAQEHLARINQLDDNLEANKLRYDNGLIDDTKYQLRIEEINIDVESTIGIYNEWMNAVNDLISDYANWLSDNKDSIVDLVLQYLNGIESAYNTVIEKIRSAIANLTDDSDLKTKALELYDDLRAYRKAGWDYS